MWWLNAVQRILLALLLVGEVAHVAHDLLQGGHPPRRLLRTRRYQVQVLLATFEDDGEALIFNTVVSVFIETLGLATFTH